MGPICVSVDNAVRNAWRGQLAATGARWGVRAQLVHHRHELLPRFATLYRQLRALPRRLRKALQRQWGASLAAVALLLTVQPGASEAANFTAGTAVELLAAINLANSTAARDTITLTADIILTATDNTTYGSTGLPVVRSALTIVGNSHTIRREPSNPDQFRLLAINGSGNLTLQETTLSGGNAPGNPGGGIYNHEGQLTLEGSTVSGNTSFGTGGVFSSGSTVVLRNSTISGNAGGAFAYHGSGGVDILFSSKVVITNSTISGNRGSSGGLFGASGGGKISGDTVTITDSTISNNMGGDGAEGAGGGGGSIYGDTVTITNSTISDNTAGSGFGGVPEGVGGELILGGTIIVTNSTISGNTGGHVGGVVLWVGTMMFVNSTVSDNRGYFGNGGSGIFNRYGSLILTNSTVSGNARSGIENYAGSVTLTNSTVSGNSAAFAGGGIYNRAGLTLTNSTVSGNSAAHGGGIGNLGGSLTLINSTVSGNGANYGGGIKNFGGSLTLTNSTVSGNGARYNGGGIYIVYGSLTLTNSTVSGNSAARNGGGIGNGGRSEYGPRGGSVILTNSTVSGNSAGFGGGIYNYYGSLTLSRSLVSGNTAPTAAEVSVTSLSSFTATFTLVGHKGLTTAAALAGFTPDPSDILATLDGNKPTALADILDTTLQDNGGSTLTQNLVAGSPAIDAAGATCDLTTDQRGAPRPVDDNGDSVAACDIGAVEFGSSPLVLDCSTTTASVNFPRLGNRHRYPVTIQGVTAPPGDTISLTITSIFQDEPVVNPTGKTCPDGIGVGTAVAKVRNERLLASDGRVYHLGFTVTDSEGASCTGEVKACVPAKEGEACGDQGALFDATVCP